MKSKNTLTFIKTKKSKLHISIFVIFLLFSSLVFYEVFSYKLFIKNFISYFDNNNFSLANNLLVTEENLNPLKSLFMKNDISKYFNTKLDKISIKVDSGEITYDNALSIISEMNRYNFINSDIEDYLNTFNKNNAFTSAVSLYNNNEFLDAYNLFITVKPNDVNYSDSLLYIDKCKQSLKADLLEKVDELCTEDYYTKSLEEINKLNSIFSGDKEIQSKIDSITKARDNYLAKQNSISQASSEHILASITNSNINSINIESITKYLINVNKKDQKTYVYEGSMNKWNLINTFTCSTGVKNEDTPNGVYTIKEKGEWFFSDKYQQGGKYWVQFYGNYLFHSLPYDKSKTKILDYTLGTPSSHGCIRLDETNAKWIYDNIPAGTKVIIK